MDNSAAAVTAVLDADDVSGVTNIEVTDADGADATAQAISLTFSAIAEATTQTFTVDGSIITDADDDLTVDGSNNATTTTTFDITGGAGDDILTGGDGADTITGGSGIDTLDGDAGNDIVTGGAGNDILTGGAGNDTVTGGDGNDIITVAAGTDNISGNAGNDTFTVGTNLTSADTLAGGDGTDILNIDAATVDADFTNVTSIETVQMRDTGTYTMGALASAAGVATITASTDAAFTLTGGSLTNNITVDAKTPANKADSYTTGSGDDTFIFDGTTGLEDGDIIVAGTGSNKIQLDNSAAGVTAVLDADDVSGVTNIELTDADGADATAQATSLTFSAVTEGTIQTFTVDGSIVTDADDDLTVAGANIAVVTTTLNITGGAGDDILGGGDGADTITGGSGADTITGDGGNDILTGGAGNDTFSTVVADLTGLDTVSGGDGTDILNITDTGTSIDEDFSNMTSVETITFANVANTITLGSKAAAAGIATVTGNGDVDTVTVGALFTNDVSITTAAGNDVVTGTGYTGKLTVNNSGGGTLALTLGTGTTALTGGAQVETVNTTADAFTSGDTITGAGGTDVINFTTAGTLTDADFTNVTTFETITAGNVAMNISLGAEAKAGGIVTVTLGNAANTVNASAYTTTALTITGGTGADTIQGGTGNDILSGGNGADVYKFNSTGALNGNDTITMVVADDTLNFSNMGSFTFNTVEAAVAGTTDVLLDNKITLLVNNGTSGDFDAASEIAAIIEGNGDAMHLASGAKGIVIAGSDADANDSAFIFLVDDSVGATQGTIAADDVVLIGTIATFDLDTLTTANFA